MKIKYIKEIADTVDFLYALLADDITTGERLSYEQAKERLDACPVTPYRVEIINDDDEQGLFDVDVGDMTFTIYRNDDGGYRINENATFYTFDTGSSLDCDTIDIEL
jgi:hypothetical protein